MIPGYLFALLAPHSNDRDSKGSKEIQTKKKKEIDKSSLHLIIWIPNKSGFHVLVRLTR